MKDRKKYLLSELRKMGVHTNAKHVPIEQLNYESLKYLLAVKRAAAY
ncbi:hypothetical protein QT711_03480 [Sporosarcina saromensis]|uniref:Fur-regulated basic protein A n=1 Tax=Sporosarcina saromensis TaxID=359365 RepID=A0ABU4G789_9BACL|nr:hypothetical protein [Sporosarcina saromensis]MDW0112232.1 hypothetical protein [Sporosarcina saromensis]